MMINNSDVLLAHVRPGSTTESGVNELLVDHLTMVARFSGQFGSDFDMPATAELLGRCHDFGKASTEFQKYIRANGSSSEEDDDSSLSSSESSRKKGPDHSTAGARWLAETPALPSGVGVLLAYAVAGHHAGLPDGNSDSRSRLEWRLARKDICDWVESCRAHLPTFLSEVNRHAIMHEFAIMTLRDSLSVASRIRMLYSALVDADYLATEMFMDGVRYGTRTGIATGLADLQQRLEEYLQAFGRNRSSSPINDIRQEIRGACLSAADEPPGLFTLEVPTGGGKTLSSIAFALKHALKHGLRRVIYVIPYTSIIEQNAEVFRRIFGEDAVLEHHSNRDPDLMGERARLLTENWDAPIVVTTNVQFFESLHANKSSRCRKLHNLSKSVVVLDEAQSLPAPFLRPCLHALDDLMCNAGSSVVICTATLPAFFRGELKGSADDPRVWNGLAGNAAGRRDITEGLNLESRLSRVSTERIAESLSDDNLAARLVGEDAVLAIVSTRRHARHLFECVRDKSDDRNCVFHLSAQMCPAHRLRVLSLVKSRLARGERCRLVTTQLVEAGVDIDFPCVYREIAGCDSMVQAAGRCNREGRLEHGRIVLFESSEKNAVPRGDLTLAANKGREVVSLPEFAQAPLSSAAVRKYFQLRYNDLDDSGDLDSAHVFDLFKLSDTPYGLQFKTCAERFRLIVEDGITVYVPYDRKGYELCEAFRSSYAVGEQKMILRRLGRYAVTVHGKEPRDAEGNLYAERVHDLAWILTSTDTHYSEECGLSTEASTDFLNV